MLESTKQSVVAKKNPPNESNLPNYVFDLPPDETDALKKALHAMYLYGCFELNRTTDKTGPKAIQRNTSYIDACFLTLGFLYEQFTWPPASYYAHLEETIPRIVELLECGLEEDHLLLSSFLCKIVLMFQHAADQSNNIPRKEEYTRLAKETLAKADRYSYYKCNGPYELRLANLYAKAASEAKYEFARKPFLEGAGRYIEKHSAKQSHNLTIYGLFAEAKRALALHSQATQAGPGTPPPLELESM